MSNEKKNKSGFKMPHIYVILFVFGIVAAAIALCGTVVGYSVGVLNPVNTGLAQTIAELPTFSGLGFRLTLFVVVLAITILFVMRYARKVKKKPEASLVYEDDAEKRKTYITCDCGEIITPNNYKRHLKTQRHFKNLQIRLLDDQNVSSS